MKHKVLRIKYLVNVSVLILLATCYLLLATKQAKADDLSLSIWPPILQIEAVPPSDIRAPFTIENQGFDSVKLKIVYKLFKGSEKENGEVRFLSEKDPFPGANPGIFENVQVVDNNFAIHNLELGPKQEKKLELRIIVPKEERFSDYYFSILFLSDNNISKDASPTQAEENSQTLTLGGIGMNVLLSIGPNDKPKGIIEEFQAPWYLEAGPVPFSIRVKNTGSHFMSPKGVILIKNMFGQTVGRVNIPETNILAGSSRLLTDSEQQKAGSSADQSSPSKAYWRENFLLGFYTASLSLALSDKGPLYTKSIHFIAFPLKFALGVFLVIIIVLIIYFRVKQKLSSN